jgi:hypothetical protein
MDCLRISAYNLCIVAEMCVTIVLCKFLNLTAMVNAPDVRHNRVKPAIILYASMMFNGWIGEVLLGLKGGIFSTQGARHSQSEVSYRHYEHHFYK